MILEVSETVDIHTDFRIWIPLSLSFCIRVNMGRGFAFDEHKEKVCNLMYTYKSLDNYHCNFAQHSSESDLFLQDLQAVINFTSTLDGSSRSGPTKWETHKTLVSKLQNFIPQPLSRADLVDLDPKHESLQTMLSLIFEELTATNKVLVSIHSSLEDQFGFLMGHLPFVSHYGTTLSSLSNNLIPKSWINSLSIENGYPETLMTALKLLKERHSFHISILQSGVMPTKFSPLMISKPNDLLSRALHQHACKYQVHPCELTIQAMVSAIQRRYDKVIGVANHRSRELILCTAKAVLHCAPVFPLK